MRTYTAMFMVFLAGGTMAADLPRPTAQSETPPVATTSSTATLPAGQTLPNAETMAKMNANEMRNLLSGLGIGTD